MSEAHLTQPHDQRINDFRSQTKIGQAHWAGTGPAGTKCVSCALAKFHGYYKKAGNTGGLKPIQCREYMKRMEDAPKFDSNVPSCRFYEQGEGPPKKGS